MAVRSRPFGALNTLGNNVSTVLYTVPVGRTAILNAWSVVNRSSEARTCVFAVRIGGVQVALRRAALAAESGWMGESDANVVLGPGDAIIVSSVGTLTTAQPINVYAGGSLLAGEPL